MQEDWLAFGPARQGRSKSGRPSGAAGAAENVKRPLVDHLDAILTSVGSKDQPGRFWSGEFFRQGEIDLPKLHRGAFGDLGGAFIINPEAGKADRDYVQAVNERWTGIKEPHFRRCAVRAEIVRQCIKLGLINHLILDTDCADELHKMAS